MCNYIGGVVHTERSVLKDSCELMQLLSAYETKFGAI